MSIRRALTGIFVLLLLLWIISLPTVLFKTSYSTVMYDSDEKLLNARVASDGQWRFPPLEKIPEKYRVALINYEDRFFYYHPGFNPGAIIRALKQNYDKGSIKSGASTISQQVIRLSRGSRKRSVSEKIVELWLATRLELRYSKSKILNLYASHAPFGGNVVGLQAASWRYYGHAQEDLTWAEAATLAVLPNSPSLIHPGRNQQRLMEKRNRLLSVLHTRGYLDELDLQLALSEPLPDSPYPLPQHAPHLFLRAQNDGFSGMQVHTSIDADLQKKAGQVLVRNHNILSGNYINNIAALIADVNTGKILAYWGNVPEGAGRVSAGHVDVIASRRSPGSLLKPFLYAGLLQDGSILPNSLVADIPTQFQGFSPENYARTFDGAVPASRALARSLNIPAVRMLMDYHPEKFLSLLKTCGLNTHDKPASHYGLSLILGGGEVSMWEIAGAYASMARTLNQWQYDQPTTPDTFFPLTYQKQPSADLHNPSPFSAGVTWHTFEAMVEAARPDQELNWKNFTGNRKIAWKTGTSFGNRDAWAIGVNAQYVVAVWAGNATGEGRPALTGIAAAAPVMFELFGLLPSPAWFNKPHDDLKEMIVCRSSGMPATDLCAPVDTLFIPRLDFQTGTCPYHKAIHLERLTHLRVNNECCPVSEMETVSWFVLPPVQEYYFKQKNPFYKTLPPFRSDCNDLSAESNPMQWIYPTAPTAIYIPYEMDGSPGEVIFRIAHRHEDVRVHWHLNGQYIGSSNQFHELACRPPAGKNTISLTDDNGNMLIREVEIKTR